MQTLRSQEAGWEGLSFPTSSAFTAQAVHARVPEVGAVRGGGGAAAGARDMRCMTYMYQVWHLEICTRTQLSPCMVPTSGCRQPYQQQHHLLLERD